MHAHGKSYEAGKQKAMTMARDVGGQHYLSAAIEDMEKMKRKLVQRFRQKKVASGSCSSSPAPAAVEEQEQQPKNQQLVILAQRSYCFKKKKEMEAKRKLKEAFGKEQKKFKQDLRNFHKEQIDMHSLINQKKDLLTKKWKEVAVMKGLIKMKRSTAVQMKLDYENLKAKLAGFKEVVEQRKQDFKKIREKHQLDMDMLEMGSDSGSESD